MSAASNLLAQGQALLAREFPATITISAVEYTAATGGLRRSERVTEGGVVGVFAATFWLGSDAFDVDGNPVPAAGTVFTWQGHQLVIDSVKPNGTQTLSIECVEVG